MSLHMEIGGWLAATVMVVAVCWAVRSVIVAAKISSRI
jgi:hypothetical protein